MGRKPMTLVISLAVRARASRCTSVEVAASGRDPLGGGGQISPVRGLARRGRFGHCGLLSSGRSMARKTKVPPLARRGHIFLCNARRVGAAYGRPARPISCKRSGRYSSMACADFAHRPWHGLALFDLPVLVHQHQRKALGAQLPPPRAGSCRIGIGDHHHIAQQQGHRIEVLQWC